MKEEEGRRYSSRSTVVCLIILVDGEAAVDIVVGLHVDEDL